MLDEMEALQGNHTWELVPHLACQNVMACKWIYKLKQDERCQIARHKARVVTNGMDQLDGVDFQETFSPIVKSATICLIVSFVVTNNWELRQLDVSNAFLHGILDDDVFMRQLSGFHDKTNPNHVCRLLKPIYVLC